MVIVYYSNFKMSDRRILKWLKEKGIRFKKIKIKKISESDLLHILSLTERGFVEIIKSNIISNDDSIHLLENLRFMDFDEGVEVLLKHPNFLKTPIIFDEENNFMIGHDLLGLRVFLSKYTKCGKDVL